MDQVNAVLQHIAIAMNELHANTIREMVHIRQRTCRQCVSVNTSDILSNYDKLLANSCCWMGKYALLLKSVMVVNECSKFSACSKFLLRKNSECLCFKFRAEFPTQIASKYI